VGRSARRRATPVGRAVVLTGAGERAFIAGTDIAEFRRFESPEDALHYEERMDAVIGALENLRIPTRPMSAGG
jgi:enoyl-CoA hydratase